MPSGFACAARRITTGAALLAGLGCGMAQAAALPAEVLQALRRADVPPQAMAVIVQEVGSTKPRLEERALAPMNPASLFKLLTTYAALDLLGPAYTWPTPVWLQGPVRDGVLDGSLVIKGSGDPKLVLERVWLLLRRVRQLGVREIHGDIVLDRSAFSVPDGAPGDFDGEPLRPYNVRPDALLLNYKSVVYTFTPDPARGVALVSAEPPLAGVSVDTSVPLNSLACDDWRAALKATFADPRVVHFAGGYPASCGERQWPVAATDPQGYNARLIEALWREAGGRLDGSVHDGAAPADAPPSFVVNSPPLADVVRDINKFSNNVMAQQLFLTLGALQKGTGTPETGRQVLRQWLADRFGETAAAGATIDNGSGLSRDTRLTPQLLAQLLQSAYASPVMPELMSSLPVIGQDGTLKRSRAPIGRGHLKTGSLRDVAGVAGYVLANSGKRYVLVALINHPHAQAARPALDALLQWTYDDTVTRDRCCTP